VSNAVSESLAGDPALPKPNRRVVITTLGMTQILAWGSSYYLPAVLAKPIAADSGWSLGWVVGGLSLGLLAAGTVSPLVGRTIDHMGGRLVLAFSSVLLAIGLAALAGAHSLPVYLFAWLLMGFGMGTGLYDAAFATLGRLYGQQARSAITSLTLFGGFASTVCWPLSAYLVEQLGWRGACGAYAAIHAFVCFPLHVLVLPGVNTITHDEKPKQNKSDSLAPTELTGIRRTRAFFLLAAILTLGSVTSSMIAVHVLTFLQARGLELAAAVGLGALVGPSQVGARVVEMASGRRYHPIWTMAASTALIASGVAFLLTGFPILALALALYGAGNGIGSIAKGTLPSGPVRPQRLRVAHGQAGHAQPVRPGVVALARGDPDRMGRSACGSRLPDRDGGCEYRPRRHAVGDRADSHADQTIRAHASPPAHAPYWVGVPPLASDCAVARCFCKVGSVAFAYSLTCPSDLLASF
jgi:MFS family permease